MIIFMCKQYEHTIAITNRALVQGDFLEQMQKVIHLHPHAVILREKDLPDDAYKTHWQKKFWLCASGKGYAAFCTPEFRLRAIWDADGFTFPFRRLRR